MISRWIGHRLSFCSLVACAVLAAPNPVLNRADGRHPAMQGSLCYATYYQGKGSDSGGTITTAPDGARTYTEVTTINYNCSSGTNGSACAFCLLTTYAQGSAPGGPFNKYVASPTIAQSQISGCSLSNLTCTVTDKLGLSPASGSWIKIL